MLLVTTHQCFDIVNLTGEIIKYKRSGVWLAGYVEIGGEEGFVTNMVCVVV